jgi:hypothetical protein
VERSITQATPGDAAPTGPAKPAGQPPKPPAGSPRLRPGGLPPLRRAGLRPIGARPTRPNQPADPVRLTPFVWGIGLVFACLFAYWLIQPNGNNLYLHFVLQAQAWLDGHTAIPMPQYQDVMPIQDTRGAPTGYGIIPFPPLPAWVLLPFVSIWHLGTNQHLLATIAAAIDVGIAYWMLGYLRVRHDIRVLTSLFFGLGTVLWYTAAIGSTWFWAHIVALGCLLLSVGAALAADREAAGPQPLKSPVTTARETRWPGGWASLLVLVALGATGELLFVLEGAGASAAELAAAGVLLALVAAVLAVVVSGRPSVLAPFLVAVAVVGGLPALLLAGAPSQPLIEVIDIALVALVVGLWWLSGRSGGRVDRGLTALAAALKRPESLQVAAGILFGLAVTARLTILFGFPFLILVGGGGTWLRRAMLAGAGAAVPLMTLLVVTYATSGHLFNPAYDYLYHVELGEYGGVFHYHANWSITDIRYVPQNLMIMLFEIPRILPHFAGVYPGDSGTQLCVSTSARGLFDASCPLAIPEATGTSIILASPAYLLAPLAFLPARVRQLDRVTVGATVAVLAIAFVNLMHFSQGWVQFGYRFSNDFAPFAILLVALGADRLGRRWPVVLLVALSIVINFWGTLWGVILGW